MVFPAIIGGLAAARAAKDIWNSAKHPRGPDGKFIHAGKFSYRVSPRSATVQYGHTLPIVPGKINLYVGALARVERSRSHETAIEKKIRAQGTKLTSKLPAKVQSVLSKGGYETGGGTSITFARPKVRQPQLRASRRIGTVGKAPTRMPITGGGAGVRQVRSPNRKPRARSITPAIVSKPAIAQATGKKVKK